MPRIGELLVSKGLITSQQLTVALEESRKTGELFGKILTNRGLVTQAELLGALAEQFGLTFYPTLKDAVIAAEVIKAIPAKFVWHYKFMPLKIVGKVLTIAVSDPLAVWSVEDLRLHLGYDVERVIASEDESLVASPSYSGATRGSARKPSKKFWRRKRRRRPSRKPSGTPSRTSRGRRRMSRSSNSSTKSCPRPSRRAPPTSILSRPRSSS